MGAAGYARVRDHFSAAQMTASFCQLYDELLKKTGLEPQPAGANRATERSDGDRGELLKQTSIIVCTVDRLTDLEECLKSLRPFHPAVAEIIVVNNGPQLAAVEEVAQRHGARVVLEAPARGKPGAQRRNPRRNGEASWHSSMMTPWPIRTGFRSCSLLFATPKCSRSRGASSLKPFADPVSQPSIFSTARSSRNRN